MVASDDDDMMNRWGVDLVNDDRQHYRTNKNPMHFQAVVKRNCTGFQLLSLEPNGTRANSKAIQLLCSDLQYCLIAMGSYCGGDGSELQNLSTSLFDKQAYIAVVVHPTILDKQEHKGCLKQTVPFPYHVPHDRLTKNSLIQLEENCLKAIRKRLLVAKLMGVPFRGLLMEPMLSGCGGEVSNGFLKKLASVLCEFNVKVILDEILTGGRVGPNMLMCDGFPKEFRECVAFVTMGKVLNFGMILEPVPKHPTQKYVRGESTKIDCSVACMKLEAIAAKISCGTITKRRTQVMEKFGLKDKNGLYNDNHWGKGCFIFISKARPSVTRNLKCRLLPKLELHTGLRKLSTKKTSWTRRTVNKMLFDAAKAWIVGQDDIFQQVNPFLIKFAEYILEKQPSVVMTNDLLLYIGDSAGSMAIEAQRKKQMLTSNSFYRKQPKTILNEMLSDIASKNPGLLIKTRTGKRRQEGYKLDYEKVRETSTDHGLVL